jgi:hypothetical protein
MKITNMSEKIACYSILFFSGAWFGCLFTAIQYIGSTFTVWNWIYGIAVSIGVLAATVNAFKGLRRIRIMDNLVDENNRGIAE